MAIRQIVVKADELALELAREGEEHYFRISSNGEGAPFDLVTYGSLEDASLEAPSLDLGDRTEAFHGAQVKTCSCSLDMDMDMEKDRVSINASNALKYDFVLCVFNVFAADNYETVPDQQVWTVVKGSDLKKMAPGGSWSPTKANVLSLVGVGENHGSFWYHGVQVHGRNIEYVLNHLIEQHIVAQDSGKLQPFAEISSPVAPNQKIAHRALVYHWVTFLKAARFKISFPQVDNTSCDFLLQWPDGRKWFRIEFVTLSDESSGVRRQESYHASIGRGNEANHTGDYDFLFVFHQVCEKVPKPCIPNLSNYSFDDWKLPDKTGDVIIIPMFACVDNRVVIIDEDWVHPNLDDGEKRGDRTFELEGSGEDITEEEQMRTSQPPNPSILLTIGTTEEGGQRQHYNSLHISPHSEPPGRSKNRSSDWARKFIVNLSEIETLAEPTE
ncbi:hypothetical protein TrRE_jg10022 [Triparma retinervis]|uniref:Uncharacterized protein n=1 Tax=Triparma retinervis TaxID=2557542 RepID=A0A9W7E163_9STRA|nr:hypothetical protein TrRE_jg10022 [Triparma retinervis]